MPSKTGFMPLFRNIGQCLTIVGYGVWVPVKNYECVIDTGDASPIAVKNIRYGPNELPILWKAIAGLEQVGHIRQINDGRWLFKCVLAAKPHQEHVRDINEFVWRFCVNYQPLNSVTRIIALNHKMSRRCTAVPPAALPSLSTESRRRGSQ